MEIAFEMHFRYKPAPSEVKSWQNSLRTMAQALQMGDLLRHGIVLEWQLPLTSRRLDCLITGRRSSDTKGATIVELKQWDEAEPTDADGCVSAFVGGAWRTVLHPAKQVGQYQRYLLDTHTAFNAGAIMLDACAYLHNMSYSAADEIYSERHKQLLDTNPVFSGDQVDNLVSYLDENVGQGEGFDVLDEVLEGKYRPNKRLLEHTAKMIKNHPSYVLIDEQQVAFETVLAKVRAWRLSDKKSVVLIKGGPGTGKSVIAINLVGALSNQGAVVQHVTGSKAFTENLRKAVGSRAAAQFSYFNSFTQADPEIIECLILDEAHRIRETSNSRFTPKQAKSDRSQIEELINASKVSVFFIDDVQVVRPGEIGSTQLIRETAASLGANLEEVELQAQFRCNGSDAFIEWVDNTLDLRRTTQVLWDARDPFDVDVVDSPQELEALIRSRNSDGETARLVAGFCWNWSKPNDDGTLVSDVKVDGWSMPWNAKPEARRLAPGIPKSNFWATDQGGIEQVGCIYTAQGFEFDHVGVIWGKDLVYRSREGWVAQPEFSKDRIVASSAKKNPKQFLDLVRQTYRVLLTRGLQSCTIYFQDAETRDFVLSRIENIGAHND